MMTDVTIEATIVEMERKINFLMKVIDKRDHSITAMKDQMKACETAESSKTHAAKVDDKGKAILQKNQTQQFISLTSLSVQQLQDMITSCMSPQYEGPPQTSFVYFKPYTKRINDL